MRWVNQYQNNSDIQRQNRKLVAYKINKNQVEYALEEIKKNKTITMIDLLSKIGIFKYLKMFFYFLIYFINGFI